MNSSGYSGTPLAKKLGIKEDFSVLVLKAPEQYWSLFTDLPDNLNIEQGFGKDKMDFIHLFLTTQEEMILQSERCKEHLKLNGSLWVSWPKGTSKIQTDLNRERIREHLLSIGLVDTKVAAIDEDWSGLKFVYRLKDRK
ncbi:DUF3052 domain-containing protein [Flagellimonas olearia]|uniref:DUF3052 family protein n=1 Tax=Flagellimonas olearia TaxID=552546 RepID=A0A444VPF0_9FLAO|nr:DUF3052 domain-containing protein [Allomuricauda olearia]RYC52661.1 hypothetical protein DN53_00125 [Allomuricauda olearia]